MNNLAKAQSNELILFTGFASQAEGADPTFAVSIQPVINMPDQVNTQAKLAAAKGHGSLIGLGGVLRSLCLCRSVKKVPLGSIPGHHETLLLINIDRSLRYRWNGINLEFIDGDGGI